MPLLQAATARFSRSPAAPPSSLDASVRQQRRLSRISPSEFDQFLDSGKTVHLGAAPASPQEATPPPPSPPPPDPPSPDLASKAPTPPLLGPEPLAAKRLLRKTRSNLGSVLEADSPPFPTTRPDHGQSGGNNALEVLDAAPQRGSAGLSGDGPEPNPDQDAPSPRTTVPAFPPTFPSPHRQQSVNRPGPRPSTATTDSRDSTVSTGSYIHVPFPPVENRPDGRLLDPNASTTSLALSGFDFSPLRKRTQSGDTGDGKMSLAGTMRKTSRFFRKLGGSSTTGTKTTSSPTTPSADRFPASITPRVPSVHTAESTSIAPSTSSSPRRSPAPRNPRVTKREIPRLPPSSYVPGATSSAMLRDDSAGSFLSDQTQSSTGSGSRRRSVSLSSLRPDARTAELASKGSPAGSSSARMPANRTEDDQLRRELKRWRLGVDGVLGAADGNISPSPSLGGTPSLASQSSPQLARTLSAVDPGGSRGPSPTSSPTLEQRRASLPVMTKELPSIQGDSAAQRSASLPTSSLLPIPPVSVHIRRPPSSDGSGTPEITVSPSSRHGSVSSATTIGPGAAGAGAASALSRGSLTRQSVSSSSSTEDGSGIGLGLATIDEAAAHSRDNSLGPVTPTKESFAAESAAAAEAASVTPTRSAPPRSGSPTPAAGTVSASSTVSNRSKGARGSIVGYPPSSSTSSRALPTFALASSLPGSAAGSSASLSSRAGAASTAKSRAKAAQEAADEALTDEQLAEKATTLAQRAWDEDELFLERRKIAEWLGSSGRVNVAALRYYIDHFDLTDLRLDVAFRKLCAKLYLKAETQQVDRILEQFSRKYFEDNPQTVYGSSDVVHAVSYSLLLLNTDLHVVDTTTRMTRQQFIRNTLEAIRAQTGDPEVISSALSLDEPVRPGTADSSAGPTTVALGSQRDGSVSNRSLERPQGAKQPSSVYSEVSGSGPKDSPAASSVNLPGSPSIPRTASTMTGTGAVTRAESPAAARRVNEASLQPVLKDMYNAIKTQPIYQISADTGSSSAVHLPDSGRPSLSLPPGASLYATWGGNVNRSASRRSANSTVSGTAGNSSTAYKRASVRGVGAFLAASGLELTRTSSPTPSTATSLSDERWNNAYGASSVHAVPTIGFANTLSHTIIREQQEDDARSEASTVEVTDEELALLGAPWAKEGILHRKHYWETAGRRAKDKNWVQGFNVVAQGELKSFRFDTGGGSRGMSGGVGGGDWTSNASNAGSISLIHALCSAMPPPGYSRERPHCFVLTLPNGGSYFFQAGTPDLVGEWVATCNYWSARLSKEPLSGGVSNMEYGWNRVDLGSNDDDDDEREEIASIRSGHSRMSYASSAFHSGATSGGVNDRVLINEWKPPQVPLQPSTLTEEAQLEALRRHVAILQDELMQHSLLRSPMLRLYSPRSNNATKALANWDRKSQHLLTESVKYKTYVDALAAAVRLRALQRGQKEVAKMLEDADADDDDDDGVIALLSPYDAPSLAAAPALPTLGPSDLAKSGSTSASGQLDPNGSRRQSRYDSAASATSATTNATNDEFFESHTDTPPPN